MSHVKLMSLRLSEFEMHMKETEGRWPQSFPHTGCFVLPLAKGICL